MIPSRPVFTFALSSIALFLAGCGGSSPASPTNNQNQTQAPTINAAVVASKIYCISGSNVNTYAANSNGTTAGAQSYPIATTGATTGPIALTLDSAGNLYVFLYQGTPALPLIQVFAPGVTTPSKTLTLTPQPAQTYAAALAIDSTGNLYVALPQVIYVYSSTATGTVAPLRTITGAATLIGTVTQMAFDSTGNLYVATSGSYPASQVIEFPATANGNAAPTVITAPTYFPTGVALDAANNIYISQGNPACTGCGSYSAAIVEFPKGSVAGATPTRTITGTNLDVTLYAEALFVDAAENVFLEALNNANEDILVYSASATGNVAPASTMVPSPATALSDLCYVK